MKKLFINELEEEKRNEIIKKNQKLENRLLQDLYEYNMFLQEEEGREMFGKDSYKYIDIKDHYSSFYLVLKDWNEFIENLNVDYIYNDDAIEYADEMDQLNGYYIEVRDDGTSDNVIRLDVAFTETFI